MSRSVYQGTWYMVRHSRRSYILIVYPLLSLEMATTGNEPIHSTLSSTSKKAGTNAETRVTSGSCNRVRLRNGS